MAVKQVQSAGRVLATFEALARHQPIGVGALSRLMNDDKSAVQRALMTLAGAGWIAQSEGAQRGWQVTSRISVLAQSAQFGWGIVERARPVLEMLRDETGETAVLNVADGGKIVVLQVATSHQILRTSPPVGLVVPTAASAAGRAILAHLPDHELADFLGRMPDDDFRAGLAVDRSRGWSLNAGDIAPEASGVGAAVLGPTGRPLASLTISAPTSRMSAATYEVLGTTVAAAAARLSGRENSSA